jgi:hypothetical protein
LFDQCLTLHQHKKIHSCQLWKDKTNFRIQQVDDTENNQRLTDRQQLAQLLVYTVIVYGYDGYVLKDHKFEWLKNQSFYAFPRPLNDLKPHDVIPHSNGFIQFRVAFRLEMLRVSGLLHLVHVNLISAWNRKLVYMLSNVKSSKQNIKLQTCVLPELPNVERRKYGGSGDINISSTSLLVSSSLNTSFKHSDCK